MQLKALIVLGSLCLVACGGVVMAQQEPVPTPNSPAWRVEVLPPSVESEVKPGFWQNIGFWLTSRAPLARPAPGTKLVVRSSAYASSPYQTDSTPCITAAGTRVRKGVVATNFLPMGTILSINGELYIVEDRMNARYQGKFLDIWFPSTSEALQFGRQTLNVTIVEYGVPGQALDRPVVKAPGALKRTSLRFVAQARLFTSYLKANVVNRHDVDCTK